MPLSGQEQAASAVIEAGATSNISVSAQAPEAAEAGSYPIQVLATVGDQSIEAELTVEITGTNLLTPTTPDQSLSNRGSAGGTINQQLVIVNDGTADLADVLITATMPRDWTVTYDPADTVAVLAAGESATVTAAIVPSNDAIAGDYVVTFSASGGDVTDQVEIRSRSKPRRSGASSASVDRGRPRRPVVGLPDLRPPVSADADRPAPIVTRGLTKRYGDLTAVDGLDPELRRGEIFGLLGQNGAGKTTTILMLLGSANRATAAPGSWASILRTRRSRSSVASATCRTAWASTTTSPGARTCATPHA